MKSHSKILLPMWSVRIDNQVVVEYPERNRIKAFPMPGLLDNFNSHYCKISNVTRNVISSSRACSIEHRVISYLDGFSPLKMRTSSHY